MGCRTCTPTGRSLLPSNPDSCREHEPPSWLPIQIRPERTNTANNTPISSSSLQVVFIVCSGADRHPTVGDNSGNRAPHAGALQRDWSARNGSMPPNPLLRRGRTDRNGTCRRVSRKFAQMGMTRVRSLPAKVCTSAGHRMTRLVLCADRVLALLVRQPIKIGEVARRSGLSVKTIPGAFWGLMDSKAQPSELSIGILWMGPMPAATHGAMAESCAMGLGQQLTSHFRLEGHGSCEGDCHAIGAESDEIHRHRCVWILIELQQAILRHLHRPIVQLTAYARRAADVRQSMERKQSLR